jgi:hypothetical protein
VAMDWTVECSTRKRVYDGTVFCRDDDTFESSPPLNIIPQH